MRSPRLTKRFLLLSIILGNLFVISRAKDISDQKPNLVADPKPNNSSEDDQPSPKKKLTSQVKEIENSVSEETAEFENADVIKNSTDLELGKIYQLQFDWMTFRTKEDLVKDDQRFHLLIVKGAGTIHIKMNDSDPYIIELDTNYEMSYIPLNTAYYLPVAKNFFEIKIDKKAKGSKEFPKIKLDYVDALDMEFNQNHRVSTQMVEFIRYRVKRPDLHVNTEGKEDRLQFILQSSLNEQKIGGVEEISMYVNKNEEFPSRTKYDFMATGNMGYGLIKSLNKKNDFYCIEQDCVYRVSIYVRDITMIYFFPTVFANYSQLNFHKYLFLLEEVEGNEIVTYELNVPDHKGDWVFTIQPMEGSPQMFVNPDEAVENISQYKYKGVGDRAEEITVTYDQSKKFGFSHRKFIVSFAGKGSHNLISTFKFEVKKLKRNEPKYISMDYAETGVVANDEVVQYRLRFQVDEPEFISFSLEHKAMVGKSIVLIKECKDDDDNCKITQKDVEVCKKFSLLSEGQTSNKGQNVIINQDDGDFSRRILQSQYKPQGGVVPPYPNQQYQNNQYQQATGGQGQYQYQGNQPIPEEMVNTGLRGVKAWPNKQQEQQPKYLIPQGMNQQGMNQQGMNQQGMNQQGMNQQGMNQQGMKQQGTNQQGMYYPDQNLQNNFSNEDMINYNDIQRGEQDPSNQTGSAPQNPNPNNGEMQRGQDSVELDRRRNIIKPSQNNLTDMPSQEMMDILSDPKKSQKFVNEVMKNKDKQLKDIYDYSNQNQQATQPNNTEKNIQNRNPDNLEQADQGTFNPEDEYNNTQIKDNSEVPSRVPYDLEKEVDPSDIRCVESSGGGNKWEMRKILMKFNCLGQNNKKSGKSWEQLDSRYPYSNKCKFAVGVFGSNQNSVEYSGSYYSIIGTGGLQHQTLKIKKSTEIIIEEKETKYIRIDISKFKKSTNTKLQIKVVAITGTCDLFFSRFNMYPSNYDNEANIQFSNEHFMSVRTSEKVILLDLDTKGQFGSVFGTIISKQYCVLDFYAQKLSSNDFEDQTRNEKLTKGKMIRRMITSKDLEEKKMDSALTTYSKSFHLVIEDELFKKDGHLKIVLNSNLLGLHLCAQRDRKVVNLDVPCAIEDQSGILEIPHSDTNLEFGMEWAVSVVYRPVIEPKLPAEFSLMYFEGNDSTTHLNMLNPGRSFNSHIKKGESVIIRVNLLSVTRSSIIILTSEDKSVRGVVSLNKYDFSKIKYVLDNENFALEMNHDQQEILCRSKESKSCVMYVRVSSSSENRSRFSLTYTMDEVPITMTEGHELFVPNKNPLYFLYDPNPVYPAEFNLESDITEFVVYSQLVSLQQVKNQPLSNLLSEFKFQYKTDIGLSEQLRIPQKHIRQAGDDVLIAFLVVPKFFKKMDSSSTVLYSTAETTRVMVKSHMSRLPAFTEGVARLNKGEFRHFFFNVDNAKNFSLVLTVQSGHADLYLNKGMFNLPTKKQYWKRKRGSRGEEMLIRKEMFHHPEEIKGVYTAGIYAETNARVSIFFLPSFKNLIKLKQQHLISMQIKKGKPFYFEFFNKLPSWDMDLYAQNSDLTISIMNYKFEKKTKTNLMEILQDDSRYLETFKFTKGSLPLKHHEDNTVENQHYVVRVQAESPEAQINLVIYDPKKPVIVPAHKRTTLVGNKDSEYIYLIELTGQFEEVKLDLKLSFGNLEFQYGDNLKNLEPSEAKQMSVPGSKDIKYKPKTERNSDIMLFNKFYVKVKTNEFSKFSLLVRGAEQFREIKEFETEIVYTLPKEEQFIYYYLSGVKSQTITSMVIDVYTVNFYGDKPKFLFNPDTDDIELDNTSKLLPMQRRDFNDIVTGEFRHIEMRPEVLKGYYIIQIPKSNHRVPIKISIGLNDVRSIEVNGVYRSQLPGGNIPVHKYSMYLPEKGEFRFLIESCQKAEIKEAKLNLYMNETPITFAENLVQASHYLFYDDRDPKHKKQIRMNYLTHVFRGVNDYPGVLEFSIQAQNEKPKGLTLDSYNKDFIMVSEFKPANRDLFFKDYVDLWKDIDHIMDNFQYQWLDRNRKLKVATFVPKFREQLMIDYPNLKKIVVKFFIYLYDDPDFMKRLELCGLAALEEVPHVRRYRPVTLRLPEDFNAPKAIAFQFSEKELDKFKNSRDLHIFCYTSISFFENELEEFEVGLELKFTNIPYFYFLTTNQYSKSTFSILKFLGFALVLIFVLFLLYLKCKSSTDEDDVREMVNATSHTRVNYSSGNPNESERRNKIEMAYL